jgi:hypothetical protein
VDTWADRRLDLWTDRRASFERGPILSRCAGPAGAESVMQGVELRLGFPVAVESGKAWRLRFRLATGTARHPS